MIGIVAREKNSKKNWMSFDPQRGTLVGNIIYQPLWDDEDKQKVDGFVDRLNSESSDYEFKTITRK